MKTYTPSGKECWDYMDYALLVNRNYFHISRLAAKKMLDTYVTDKGKTYITTPPEKYKERIKQDKQTKEFDLSSKYPSIIDLRKHNAK